MRFTLAALAALLPLLVVLLSASVQRVEAAKVGLAYATDNRWAAKIAKGRISWYWHWQDGKIDQMPSHVEYVPCIWGPKYYNKWKAQAKWKKAPARILAFNEVDVASQANMSPSYAADQWMKYLHPWQKKGSKVSTPQIVFDLDWMDKFMKALKQRGARPDFMAIHWYGTPNDAGFKRFTSWVSRCRKRYGMKIWVTEYGVTTKGTSSQGQVNAFNKRATNWLLSKSYVKRIAWFGCFAFNNPPDQFASRRNALFNSNASLRSIARFYQSGHYRRDLSVASALEHRAVASPGAKRHAKMAELLNAREEASGETYEDIDDEVVEGEVDDESDDCDEICQKREASLNSLVDGDALEDPDVVLPEDDDEE